MKYELPVPVRAMAAAWSQTHIEALTWLFKRVLSLRSPSSRGPSINVVEVGSFRGGSAVVLAEAIRLAACGGRVLCVENFLNWNGKEGVRPLPAGTYEAFLRHTKVYCELELIGLNEGGSLAAAEVVEDGSKDLVFLDGDHTCDGCKADIQAWMPKLVDGGIICGHDLTGEPGVLQAVEELVPAWAAAPGDLWWAVAPLVRREDVDPGEVIRRFV